MLIDASVEKRLFLTWCYRVIKTRILSMRCRLPAEEEHRDSVGVDNTGGLHEQVQGGQQECGGNTGGVGKLRNIY